MNLLYLLLIRPVEYVLELVFNLFYRFSGSVPFSILGLSISVSLLSLPLYLQAEDLAQKEKECRKKMSFWEERIKKAFKKDERSFILQYYYSREGYMPYKVLMGALPLLLQIPFFAAAYHLLVGNDLLNASSFMGITDLSRADGLLWSGRINILPIIMTAISIISGCLYTSGMKWKDKWNVFLLPLIFLIFLYGSPSGMVLYWTANNLFSLCKNIVMKHSKHSKAWLLGAVAGLLVLFCTAVITGKADSYDKTQFLIFAIYMLVMTGLYILLINYIKKEHKVAGDAEERSWIRMWMGSSLLLTILIGGWIPVNLIAASPLEFIIDGIIDDPRVYLYMTVSIAFGSFIIFGGLIMYMLKKEHRWIFSLLMICLAFSALINFVFFGKGLKTIGANLIYPEKTEFYGDHLGINMALMIIIPLFVCLMMKKKKVLEGFIVIAIMCVSFSLMREYNNIASALKEAKALSENETYSDKYFDFSKEGKNVVVIMLDRAISAYVPYILEERPELKETYSGFVYYPNTICFGPTTHTASHAAYGGYEYVPDAYSKRVEKTSKEVANEAQKVLPVMFYNEGYEVTMCDPPSTGVYEKSRLYLYNDYPGINAYNLLGRFADKNTVKQSLDLVERNFFLYGIFRSLPEILAPMMYDWGAYINYKSPGNWIFMCSFAELDVLPQISFVDSENTKGSFCYIYNLITHEPTFLQMPEYVPATEIDNSRFKDKTIAKFYNDQNYSVNISALLRIGEWVNWMKENKVYDNTRIIIVADHGWHYNDFDEMCFDIPGTNRRMNVERFNPLLMYKDFYAGGEITVSDEFMTNADVPWLCVRSLIDEPINPFTGNKISETQKADTPIYITEQWGGEIPISGGIEYNDDWYSVEGDMFDRNSWTFHERKE